MRAELSAAQLASPAATEGRPIANRWFAPVGPLSPQPPQQLVASLRIPAHHMASEPAAIEPAELGGKLTQLFPAVTLRFVSYAEHLVPAERGALLEDEERQSWWSLIPEVGCVWREEGDGGASRAAFPFILTSRVENESYYGLATFVYGGDVRRSPQPALLPC